MHNQVFLGIGSNLGDRLSHMRWAVDQLARHPAIYRISASPVYESEAHVLDEQEKQPAYLNAVLSMRTTLSPDALLALINQLERERGRDRQGEKRWASRTLDLDILAYGRQTTRTNRLQIPHRRLDQRKFVLLPWADLAPAFEVPAPFDDTVENLKERCPDSTMLVPTSHKLLD